MIPAARAIWVYKWDVFYAWAGGIAIDLIPTIFVILLTLGRAREDEEREREAHAAAQPVPMPRSVARGGTWPGRPGPEAAAFDAPEAYTPYQRAPS